MMKIELKLSDDWIFRDEVGIIGYAFFEEKLLKIEELHQVFCKPKTAEEVEELLKKLNGRFSFIIQKANLKAFGVDHLRSHPLLYKKEDHQITITDDAFHLWGAEKLNASAIESIKWNYLVKGNETLFTDYQALMAGEFMFWQEEKGWEINHYFYQLWETKERTIAEVDEIYNQSFQRLYAYLDGRKPVLSLSSGGDSRLILVKLLDFFPASEIECFSYGPREHYDVWQSEQICRKLGISWRWIDYSPELMKKELGTRFNTYLRANNHGTSLPCEQNYFAAAEMQDRNLYAKENQVIISGVIGNALGWNFHPKLSKKYLEDFTKAHPEIPEERKLNTFFNDWFKEKISKFIINSLGSYSFFNRDYYIPFMDSELIKFWMSTNYHQKLDNNLYNLYISNILSSKGIGKKSYEHYWEYKIKRRLSIFYPDLNPHYKHCFINMAFIQLSEEEKKEISSEIDNLNTVLAKYFINQLKQFM